MCKKRVAALRDELLFALPERCHLGDGPICFLPMPLPTNQRVITLCCSKIICIGCSYSDKKRQITQALEQTCPFCRELLPPRIHGESYVSLMRRAEANDPNAISKVADNYRSRGYPPRRWNAGKRQLHWEMRKHIIVCPWSIGRERCIEKDEKWHIYHMEEAAIAGHHLARANLGIFNRNHGWFDTAMKHWVIAANLGHDVSVKSLKLCYVKGLVSKDDCAAQLLLITLQCVQRKVHKERQQRKLTIYYLVISRADTRRGRSKCKHDTMNCRLPLRC